MISCWGASPGPDRRSRTGIGYRVNVSPAEKLGYLLGTDEPHLQKAIRNHVVVGDTVYDIGANVVTYRCHWQKQVGPRSVIAFEPIPSSATPFGKHQINGITNVRLLNLAASDNSGETVIRMTENAATASLVWHRNEPSATELHVVRGHRRTCGGREFGLPSFVKIDVEGAEGSVLHGMRDTIAAGRLSVCGMLGCRPRTNVAIAQN